MTGETIAVRHGRALGTEVTLATTAADPETCWHLLGTELAAIDLACSRFRPDSEVRALQGAGGRALAVSPRCGEAIEVALEMAQRTGGLVDPTVGEVLVRLGYDRDFAAVAADRDEPVPAGSPAIGWWSVEVDRRAGTVRVPAGVLVDLGATGKAFAADRAAARLARRSGAGVLVSLGGDVAVAGEPPASGWPIGIAWVSGAPASEVRQCIALRHGGLASSSGAARAWRRAGQSQHHIVDPRTGQSVASRWRLASVVAPSCVEANAWATAAIVASSEAPERLEATGLAARLEAFDGTVIHLGAWPAPSQLAVLGP